MKKRLIDAKHLMQRLEANYGSDNSWYDLARAKAIIDTEPAAFPDRRELVEAMLIFLVAILIMIVIFASGVLY
jgi:hypothetical protein